MWTSLGLSQSRNPTSHFVLHKAVKSTIVRLLLTLSSHCRLRLPAAPLSLSKCRNKKKWEHCDLVILEGTHNWVRDYGKLGHFLLFLASLYLLATAPVHPSPHILIICLCHPLPHHHPSFPSLIALPTGRTQSDLTPSSNVASVYETRQKENFRGHFLPFIEPACRVQLYKQRGNKRSTSQCFYALVLLFERSHRSSRCCVVAHD